MDDRQPPPDPRDTAYWRRPQFWIGLGLSLACLAGIFIVIEPAEIWAALQTARYGLLVLSGLGIVGFQVLRAIRWRYMLQNRVALAQVFHIQNIGYMLNYLLPLRLGEAARAVLIGNVPPLTLPQGLSTMVMERVLDVLFIVILLPFTLVAARSLPSQWETAFRSAGMLAVGATLLLIAAANQRGRVRSLMTGLLNRIRFLDTGRWVGRIDELLSGLDNLTRLRDGAILLVLSVIVWLPILYAYRVALQAVGLEPSLAMAGFVVCAAALSIAAPSSPGQIGVFHAGVIFALTQILGQPEGPSTAFAFLYHAVNFLIVVLLGLVAIPPTGATFGRVVGAARSLADRRQPAGRSEDGSSAP